MKKTLIMFAVFILCSSAGCSLIEKSVSNIGGWDLSACVGKDEFKVCRELFFDNEEQILGGKTIVELAIERMKNAKTAKVTNPEEEVE